MPTSGRLVRLLPCPDRKRSSTPRDGEGAWCAASGLWSSVVYAVIYCLRWIWCQRPNGMSTASLALLVLLWHRVSGQATRPLGRPVALWRSEGGDGGQEAAAMPWPGGLRMAALQNGDGGIPWPGRLRSLRSSRMTDGSGGRGRARPTCGCGAIRGVQLGGAGTSVRLRSGQALRPDGAGKLLPSRSFPLPTAQDTRSTDRPRRTRRSCPPD